MHDNFGEGIFDDASGLGLLLDCPDCGGTPDIKENYRAIEGALFSGVVCHQCNLVALHFNTQSGINLWNEMVQEWMDRESTGK